MKFYAVKLAFFGVISSTLFGSVALGLSYLTSLGYPEALKLAFSIYCLAGYPLAYIFSLVLTDETLARLFGDDSAFVASFVIFLASSFVTWSLLFALLRHAWLRKRQSVA